MFKQKKNMISAANLSWNENGEPTSVEFNDIYFNTADGLDETTYVFIEKNYLLQRWQDCTSAFYVIGETGFGSGLNFLVTWQHFTHFRAKNPEHPLKRLYFISFEKYPLSANDLVKSHDRWPSLAKQAQQLQEQYPAAIAGCHRLPFASAHNEHNAVILDLWFGDIKDTITQLSVPPNGLVDSWFLDGFAPSKNPEMWNQTLYNNMAKLSKDRASLATFTAAGDVRRGLQHAGFTIKKAKGFGKKREMITALFNRNTPFTSHNSWFHRPAISSKTERVTIIGGGVASTSLAYALAQRGVDSEIICQDDELAAGASGNRQGGFYPLLNSQHDFLSQCYSHGFFFAKNLYQYLISEDISVGDLCGVLSLGSDDKMSTAHQKIIDSDIFPQDLVHAVNATTASELCGVPISHNALFYPTGGWISPKQLTKSLLKKAQALASVQVKFNRRVSSMTYVDNHWQLDLQDGTHQATTVVVASGHELMNFAQCEHLPLYATSGQVSHLTESKQSGALKKVLCYQGYITPSKNSQHCLGASFNRDVSGYAVNDIEHQQNIDKLNSDVPSLTLNNLSNINGGKVGVRGSVKDHLPMVGAVPDYHQTKSVYNDLHKGKPAHKYANAPVHQQLFMLGGLGSRGLCSAPMLAEILSCQLTQEPMPVSQQLLDQLNPNRYWIKQLKKHNVDI